MRRRRKSHFRRGCAGAGGRTPHGEGDVLVLHRLHVEADRRNRGDDLAELELVEDGGLSGCVQPHHQDTHLLLANQSLEELAEY